MIVVQYMFLNTLFYLVAYLVFTSSQEIKSFDNKNRKSLTGLLVFWMYALDPVHTIFACVYRYSVGTLHSNKKGGTRVEWKKLWVFTFIELTFTNALQYSYFSINYLL